MTMEKGFRCARCPKQIKPEDTRVKIDRFTYCESCALEKMEEKPKIERPR